MNDYTELDLISDSEYDYILNQVDEVEDIFDWNEVEDFEEWNDIG